jgi:hypothetical protein
MSYGQLTLSIPGASPPVPSLTISMFPDGGYSRSLLGLTQVSDFSAYGTPVLTGPLSNRYIWSISAVLTEADALQLEALILWSSGQYKARQDGALALVDEVEYLTPEPSPHSRSLISAITPTWSASYEYGYGQFSVQVSLAEDNPRAHKGRASSGLFKEVQFSIVEV